MSPTSASWAMVIAGAAAVALLVAVIVSLAWVVGSDDWPAPPGTRLALLAAIVAVAGAAMASLISSSAFVWDDIPNLRQAQVEPLSIDFLLEPTSGHLAPGHRLADWLFMRLFEFDYGPAAVILVVGYALTLLVFHRLLTELFGAGAGPLVLTLIYAVAITHVGVIQWWASGMDRLPATFLSFLAMVWYVRWFRTRAWPYVAASVASLAVAQCFYFKPVLVPLYLVMLRVLLLEPERPLRETASQALQEWRVWVAYIVPAALFAILYVSIYRTSSARRTSAAELMEYVGGVWLRVLVPNLFGIWVPSEEVPVLAWVGAVAAHVALVALVAWSIARWRPAWRAWALFAIGWAVNAIAAAGSYTIPLLGVKTVTYLIFYNLEATFLFALALGAAVLRPRALERAAGPPALSRSLASPARRALTALGIAVYAGLSWWGGYRISQPDVWSGARSRAYQEVAADELRRLSLDGRTIGLVDGVVSPDMVLQLSTPYNSASEVFPLIQPGVDFDATRPELYHLDQSGRARAVTFQSSYGGDMLILLQRQLVEVSAATASVVGDALCITTSDEAGSIKLAQIPGLAGDDLALRLAFDAATASRLALLVHPQPLIASGLDRGRANFRSMNLAAESGQTRVYTLEAPVVETVFLIFGPHADVCVRRLEVGRLLPRSS